MTKLAYLRKRNGLTQEEMAKDLGIGLSTYNQYENLQRSIPLQVAEKIASLFNIHVNEIFLPVKFTVSKTKAMKGDNQDGIDITEN